MAKQSRKKLRRPKRRSFRKRTSKAGRAYGKMVGGDFTQEENQQLLGLGFSQQDVEVLAGTGVGLNIIQMSLNQVNPATGAPFTPQELIQSVNEVNEEINQLDISGISNASEDDHNLDDEQNLNDSMNTTSEETNLNDSNVFNENNNSQDSLHLSDLNVSDNNGSTNTTMEDDSFGGRKLKASRTYGKTRKGRKGRKHDRKHGRKSRKQRGGVCFGNGVGANNYDPNFSIYNTRELTLFPYRPTN